MRTKAALSFLLFTAFWGTALGQFKPNSIGVCYLQKEDAEFYHLTVALPFETLQKQEIQYDTVFKTVIDTVAYSGQIILFDNAGEVFRINNKKKFLLQFWCDDDGGTQYRPTLKMRIKKTDLKRPLTAINKIQKICCFVMVNSTGRGMEPVKIPSNKPVAMKGDYNGDGKTDCFLWTYYDEAENCDGKPANNLGIVLSVGNKEYRLRCCGP